MTEVAQKFESSLEKYEEFSITDIKDMVAEYQTIMVPEGDEGAFKVARKALTICVRTRTAIDKRRKENGADLREALIKVNADGNSLIDLIAPAEKHLKGQVEPERDRLKAIEAARHKARLDKVDGWMTEATKYGTQYGYDIISKMEDDEFEEHLFEIKEKYDLSQKLMKVQEKRAKEQAAQIAAEQEAQAEKLEAIRVAQEEKYKKIQDEMDTKQAEIDAKEAALKAAEEAEAERERIQQEEINRVHREAEEAERAERLKPDKTKAIEWVWAMRESLPLIPVIEDNDLRNVIVRTLNEIMGELDICHKQIEDL